MQTNTIQLPNSITLEDIIKNAVTAAMVAIQASTAEQEEPEHYVPEITVKAYKGFEDYPDVLQVKHCRVILGLSEAKTYEVINSEKCPSFTVGKRKLIRKEAFMQYLIDNEGQDLIE